MLKIFVALVHIAIHNNMWRHSEKLERFHSKLQNLFQKHENIKLTHSIP